jgi:hypothetical protein
VRHLLKKQLVLHHPLGWPHEQVLQLSQCGC